MLPPPREDRAPGVRWIEEVNQFDRMCLKVDNPASQLAKICRRTACVTVALRLRR